MKSLSFSGLFSNSLSSSAENQLQYLESALFLLALFTSLAFCLYIVSGLKKPESGHPSKSNFILMGATVSILALLLAGLFYGGSALYSKTLKKPGNVDMEIALSKNKDGLQFSYKNGKVNSSDFKIPSATNLLLKSQGFGELDSLHIKGINLKANLNSQEGINLRADQKGLTSYYLKFPKGHGSESGNLEVLPIEEFKAWLKEAADAGPAGASPEEGKKLYSEKGCIGCHSVDGSAMVGPSFKGLFGKTEPLEDGEVKVDDAYLIESIAEPAAKVVKGFAPSMPAYKFSEDEMANILAFIKSLK